MKRFSELLRESIYKPPPPSKFAKKNIAKRKPYYDSTKRYTIRGVVKDLVDRCQVCGTRIRKCVILFDDLSHDEVIVGSDCAAIMTGWTLGQVERKAKKAQQERDVEAEKAEWDQIYKNKNYDVLKRLFTQVVRAKPDDRPAWISRFEKRLGIMVGELRLSRDHVLGVLKKRGWKLEKFLS